MKVHGYLELLGVTLVGVPGLAITHVDLRGEQPQVFYGRNGAGKTRLLEALMSALSGRRLPEGQAYISALWDLGETDESSFVGEMAVAQEWNNVRGLTNLMAQYEGLEIDVNSHDREAVNVWQHLPGLVEEYRSWPLIPEGFDLLAEQVDAYVNACADAFRTPDQTCPEGLSITIVPKGLESAVVDVHLALPMAVGSPQRSSVISWLQEWIETGAGPLQPQILRLREDASDDPERDLFAIDNWHGLDFTPLDPVAVAASANPTESAELPGMWPTWAHFPLVPVAQHATTWPINVASLQATEPTGEDDHDARTRALFGDVLEGHLDGESLLTDPAHARSEVINELVNVVFADVLPAAPELRFDLGSPNTWFHGVLPCWLAHSHETSIPLTDLSATERRWARFAIELVLVLASAGQLNFRDETTEVTDDDYLEKFRLEAAELLKPQYQVLVIVDEPERGMHRSAEALLAGFLTRLSDNFGVVALVASHSPTLVSSTEIAPLHVERSPLDGRTRCFPIQMPLGDAFEQEFGAEALGLRKADLFLITRKFILVEGEHDEIVLRGLLGAQLQATLSQVWPIGGAKELNASLNTRAIVDQTDADIIYVVDNASPATSLWATFQDAVTRKDKHAQASAINSLRDLGTGEGKWLSEFAKRVRHRGLQERIRVFGLTEPDIICYLPAEEFVPGSDWTDLLARWREGSRRPVNLKGWLYEKHGVRINGDRIKQVVAASAGAEFHPDLVRLGQLMGE